MSSTPRLLVSAFIGPADPPDTVGGLFLLEGGSFTQLDDRPTAGLCYHNGKLVQGLRHQDRSRTPSEMVIHEDSGPRLVTLPGVASLHDVCSTPEGLAVVATSQNRVVWFDEQGKHLRQWQPSSAPDSWHLNSLLWHDGQLLASAFGRHDKPEAWREYWQSRQGVVVDVDTNKVILDGLTTPHSPRLLPEGWLVCQSRLGIVTVGDRSVDLRGWTRGAAVTETAIYVGVSAHFFPRVGNTDFNILPEIPRAMVAVIDRSHLTLMGSFALPANVRHLYDVVIYE